MCCLVLAVPVSPHKIKKREKNIDSGDIILYTTKGEQKMQRVSQSNRLIYNAEGKQQKLFSNFKLTVHFDALEMRKKTQDCGCFSQEDNILQIDR
jgi:hypothetical protein